MSGQTVYDITYGLLASGSCLLTDVVDQLHESSKKINIVDRLSRHLEKGTPGKAVASYLHTIKKWVPDEPVIHIDDSDVVELSIRSPLFFCLVGFCFVTLILPQILIP